MQGVLRRLAAAALFLGMWFVLQGASLGFYVGLSVGFGYVVNRWWAPVIVFFVLLAVLALSLGLGDSEVDESNVVFVLFGIVVVPAVIAMGVLLATLASWLWARGKSPSADGR